MSCLHIYKEHYGYSLRKQIGAKGLKIDEGTLYPLIRRLETQGLLESEWRTLNASIDCILEES